MYSIILQSILFLTLIYFVYQLFRNKATYNLVSKWIYEDNDLYEKYDYNFIMKPSKHNWYGLMYPTENKYK